MNSASLMRSVLSLSVDCLELFQAAIDDKIKTMQLTQEAAQEEREISSTVGATFLEAHPELMASKTLFKKSGPAPSKNVLAIREYLDAKAKACPEGFKINWAEMSAATGVAITGSIKNACYNTIGFNRANGVWKKVA